ncbi:MAG: ABC-2 transporter permease [Planctomycetota bacterium]|nr:ABC-2 transporter permease [Planctomycetota bacterium]
MINATRQLLTIGRNTFIESIRQPIFSVLTLVAIMGLILNPMLAMFTIDDDNKIMIDMGLSTLFIAGLLLAAFTATGVLAHEIENKTVLTVVSKPVSRPVFVLGKYVGVVGAIALAYWILAIVFLLGVRHGVMQTAAEGLDGPVLSFGVAAGAGALLIAALANYFYHWSFTSTLVSLLGLFLTGAGLFVGFVDKHWDPQSFNLAESSLAWGLFLIFLGLMVLTAVAIAASTRLGQIMTLIICTGAFFLGLISDFMFSRGMSGNRLVELLYRITPNLQAFWTADAITEKNPFTLGYMGWTAAYAACFIAALLSLAIALFQTREVG